MFYSVDIFKNAGSTLDANTSAIIIGVVQALATFIACVLMDRAGRRLLLLLSSLVMSISLLFMALYYFLEDKLGTSFHQDFNWLPLVSLVLFVFAFSIGFGPIPWLVAGEVLPNRVKGITSGMATSFNWICLFIVAKFFINVVATVHEEGTYLILAMVCLLGSVFVGFFIPETNGKTLQEIEAIFNGENMEVEINSIQASSE
jgi:facilitated trehalose transporter